MQKYAWNEGYESKLNAGEEWIYVYWTTIGLRWSKESNTFWRSILTENVAMEIERNLAMGMVKFLLKNTTEMILIF